MNGTEHIPFRWNNTQQKHHRLYASYCTCTVQTTSNLTLACVAGGVNACEMPACAYIPCAHIYFVNAHEHYGVGCDLHVLYITVVLERNAN